MTVTGNGLRALVGGCLAVLGGASALAQDGPPPGAYIIEYETIHHPVVSRGGMVVSQNALSSQIGAEVLERGGNAVDAAVATGLALAVTLPRAGNLGGGGFMLIHLAEENRTIAIEYYGEAPSGVYDGMLLGEGDRLDRAKRYSHLGAAVPGTPLGLYEAHTRYGRLDWADVVEPAVRIAEDGIVMTEDMHYVLDLRRDWISMDDGAARALYREDGEAYRPGEILRQPDLAWSLRQYRDHGADAFYTGEVAERIAASMENNGGIITMDDLAAYRIHEGDPIWARYRGHPIALVPPTASGVLLGQMMNILEAFDIAAMGSRSAAEIHTLAEATRLVYADRARFMGGYPQHEVPVAALMDRDYAVVRAALIAPDSVLETEAVEPGSPALIDNPDTTHYSVVDSDGNAVSNTYTLGSSFGTHVMAEGTGFFLNDNMANFRWSEPPGSPNAPAPGKRAISTITPVMVFDEDDGLWVVSGTPGGLRIIPVMAQLLVNMIDHGMSAADATATPRAYHGYGDVLELEPGHSPDTVRALEAIGHRIDGALTMGSVQTIEIRPDGVLHGAADPRRPGSGAAAAP